LSNVVTDPEYRRLGLSRACVEQLHKWFRDVTDPNDGGFFTTDCGASLYESLGFGGRSNPAMSLNIRRAEVMPRRPMMISANQRRRQDDECDRECCHGAHSSAQACRVG